MIEDVEERSRSLLLDALSEEEMQAEPKQHPNGCKDQRDVLGPSLKRW